MKREWERERENVSTAEHPLIHRTRDAPRANVPRETSNWLGDENSSNARDAPLNFKTRSGPNWTGQVWRKILATKFAEISNSGIRDSKHVKERKRENERELNTRADTQKNRDRDVSEANASEERNFRRQQQVWHPLPSLPFTFPRTPSHPSQGARVLLSLSLSHSPPPLRPRCECKTNNAVCSSNRVTKNRINLSSSCSSSSSSSSLCICAFCADTYLSIVFLFFLLFVCALRGRPDLRVCLKPCGVHDDLRTFYARVLV